VSAVEEYRLAADRWEVDSHDHGDEAVNAADAAIADLEAHAEHDEDNLAGLEHALVRANQRYTQAEAERDFAVDILVVHGLDAKFFDGVGWTTTLTDSPTIPTGARERIRKMLSETDRQSSPAHRPPPD